MNEGSIYGYRETDNFDEEEHNSDLESRLYANIYYAPVETETSDETSVNSKVVSTNKKKVNDIAISDDNERDRRSVNCTDNERNMERDSCKSVSQDKELINNEVEKTQCTDSVQKAYNVNKDPYTFDANVEDQIAILPMNTKKRKKKKKSKNEIKSQLLNFVFKVPSTIPTSSISSNNISKRSSNRCNAKQSGVSNIVTSDKKSGQSGQEKRSSENVFTTYKNSKQCINQIYTERRKEMEEVNTKYSVVEKKEKKKIRDIEESNNATRDEEDSDSDQSILEVPIPPKPQPLLINLNDSDEDSMPPHNETETTNKPLTIEHCNTTDFRQQVKIALAKSQTVLNNSENVDNINAAGDIVLNCTEVHKGASSITEIREMRKDVQKKKDSRDAKKVNSNVLQESAKDNNNKNKSGKKKTNVNNKQCGSENKSQMDKATAKGKNNTSTLLDTSTDFTEDILPVDEFLMSQNELNSNKRKLLEHEQETNGNVKRAKKKATKEIKQSGSDKTIDDSFFHPMSDKLRAFYTNSRGQENYDLSEVQSKMSKDPRLWAILDEDLTQRSKKQRFWDVRCTLCHQQGHMRYNCTETRRPPKCYMCGIEGHVESRCPQKMCLTCGKRQGTFRKTCETCRTLYCTMCSAVGHKQTECPDLWRRYHQTTTTDNVSIPYNVLGVMKPANLLYCCNCTKRGHDSSVCKDYRWSQHFPTPSFVSNYTDGPTYTAEQTRSANVAQRQSATDNGKSKTSTITTVPASDDMLPFPPELVSMKQSERKAFPQHVWENNNNIAYIIYECGQFYTLENNGMEVTCTIAAVREYNTKSVMKCQIVPHFLENLLGLFMFHVKIYKEVGPMKEIILRIRTFADLINDLRRLILYWLSLEDDEKDGALYLDLPLKRIPLINVLSSKIAKLGSELGHDLALYNLIFAMKEELTFKLSKETYTITLNRIHEMQSRLLLLLSDRPHLRKFSEEIRQLLRIVEESRNENVPLQTFLQILTVYNFLFVPHTPPKCFISQYSSKSKSKTSDKRKSTNTLTPMKGSTIPVLITNRGPTLSNNNPQCSVPTQCNSIRKEYQETMNLMIKKTQPTKSTGYADRSTRSSHYRFRFDDVPDEAQRKVILEKHQTPESHDSSEVTIIPNEKHADNLALSKSITRHDLASTSYDSHSQNATSDKYTNITVNVLNKNQATAADNLNLKMNDSKTNEYQNVNKCTNITLNVSNKEHATTANNSTSSTIDSQKDTCDNSNKYTNITVSVSNKNQANTNKKSEKNQKSNKYTNIIVNVSNKDQVRPANSTTSNLNSFKNNNCQSSTMVDYVKEGKSNNEDDMVCIEVKKKASSNITAQQCESKSNKKVINEENPNANPKKNSKATIKKGRTISSREANRSERVCRQLLMARRTIKNELERCSFDDVENCRKVVTHIRNMINSFKIPHLTCAGNALKGKIHKSDALRNNITMLNNLIDVELQYHRRMKKLYKRFARNSCQQQNSQRISEQAK